MTITGRLVSLSHLTETPLDLATCSFVLATDRGLVFHNINDRVNVVEVPFHRGRLVAK
jgi:hypothetical protein